ncbi:MAG: flavin reductase family protein [Methylotenera sp.]|nr:flavin reductase family protein [Methylotenera sp.]MDO9232139.1 flavin reductase family protein [Methylotenera sp.]MDO9388704.1 flavin reductase family protein [Methylotenera sp.]MDP2101099.1 flavin reductase family protein [Methylotenera sp.]MDP2280341.1 flavin reductase family protein [Methylotenera sp.]
MQKINLDKAYRLLNHGPTILVSSSFNGKQNIMAVAWNMPLDFDPPKICVVIDKNTYTRELIEASGTFAINVPCVAQVSLVTKLGSSSGRELNGTDKFAENQLETFAAKHIAAPLLAGCVAWLECKIISEPHNQNTFDLFIAEVVAAYADERVFSDGRWHFEGHDQEEYDKLRTIHHVAGGAFFATGVAIQANI